MGLTTLKGRSADGFELKLRSLLDGRFTPQPLGQITARFPVIEGKTICRVDAAPDGRIYHLDGAIYVRDGNRTVELKGPALTAWVRSRTP